MSFSHFRAALSFKKTDSQKPAVPVSSNPQYHPSTARTSAPRRGSVTGRNSVRRISNRRTSIKSSTSIRRVGRLPRLEIDGIVSNESGDPLNYLYSGFFYDDDEVDRNEPNLFTHHSSRQTVTSRRTSNRQRASLFTRLTSRGKPSENATIRRKLPKADDGYTHNSHPGFHPEESTSSNSPSSEAMASSEPSHLTSIIPDPAGCSRFSLGTLLLPQAPQSGFKHRNRKTTLISSSKPTLESHSGCTAESEWEDLGDIEGALEEVKTKEGQSAWANLTSDVGPHVAPSDGTALSVLEPRETINMSQDLLAESAPQTLCRTESISTASSGIDIDALPSVTSHLDTPFTPVADQFPTSVWECQYSALRSSTDLVHGSLEAKTALADLIDVLGLDNNAAGPGLSNKAPQESMSTKEVPVRPPKKDTLLDTRRPVTPPAELLLPPSPDTPKYATIPASRRPTLDRSDPFTKPTPSSFHEELNQSFHPILDIEVKKFSLSGTQALKSLPLHPHRSRDRLVPKPHSPRSNRKSFLPDMSGWIIETEARVKKARGPSTEPQSFRSHMDQLSPTLDSLLPGKKGKGQTSSIFPRLFSRSTKPPLPHWPPVSSSQPALLSQDAVDGTRSTRRNSLKASRFDRRASRVNGSDSSLESPIPPLPTMTHLSA